MAIRKDTALAPRDPFTLLRRMTAELDRVFDEPFQAFGWPLQTLTGPRVAAWSPGIDVFEKDNHLVTRIDLPGMKKSDVKVEVTDGFLAISGERKTDAEETKDNYYRCEREHGTFYRAVPLPAGATPEDVKATFADGVLEVSVPLPAKVASRTRKVEIADAAKPARAA